MQDPLPTEDASLGLAATGILALRGERVVLRRVSLAVPPGGALLLTGANGSGKSTLLRVLAGLKRPERGRVAWCGRDAADLPTHAAILAYLGHQDAIKPALLVAEAVPAGPGGAAALDAMGLADLRALPARLLSAGQRRRLALARVLAAAVPLWLLDEPTLGLDQAAVDRLGAALARHRAGGGVVVAATHLPLPLPGAAELRL